MRVREQCMMQLVKIIEEEGTAIAYPTQSVFLDNVPTPSGKKPSSSGTTVIAEAPKKAAIAKASAVKPKK